MVIDTSAIVAILRGEPDAARLRIALAADRRRLISTVSVLEATCVLTSRHGSGALLDLNMFLAEFGIEQVPFEVGHLVAAQRAWLSYGKGQNPAGLNFGDCAAYGLALVLGEPSLYIGTDFSRTDVVNAAP